ncbi:MAG: GNAT family N-acetyltransferase [Firmicutes bacterium]|nr:GNAT family N-acetyltransferase [Bacillota bacterium]
MEFCMATQSDLHHIIDMRIQYLKEINQKLSDKEKGALLQHLPGYYQKHMGKDFFAYLAMDGDTPASTVFLLIIERPANLHFITGKTGILLNVYTRPAYRKRGLASVLLDMAVADAKKMNVSNIELQATEMGVPLYEKLGFTHKQSQYTYMEYRFDSQGDNAAVKP